MIILEITRQDALQFIETEGRNHGWSREFANQQITHMMTQYALEKVSQVAIGIEKQLKQTMHNLDGIKLESSKR